MAKKKPLVITNGVVERLQPGDHIDLSRSATKTNNTGNTLNKATPVYVNGGDAIPGKADAISTARISGFTEATVADGATVDIQTDGIFVATTTEWDAVTGQTGGLTEGSEYYLDATTAGMMTATAPDSDGEIVAPLGRALSSTEFDIEISRPIKL